MEKNELIRLARDNCANWFRDECVFYGQCMPEKCKWFEVAVLPLYPQWAIEDEIKRGVQRLACKRRTKNVRA